MKLAIQTFYCSVCPSLLWTTEIIEFSTDGIEAFNIGFVSIREIFVMYKCIKRYSIDIDY